jgi:hypothetical protein
MLSNHARLGENGAHIKATVDHRTLYNLDLLKDRIAKHFNIKASAGMVIRRAVEDLIKQSEQWANIEPSDKIVEHRKLEQAKKARPAPDSAAAAYEQDSEMLMRQRG